MTLSHAGSFCAMLIHPQKQICRETANSPEIRTLILFKNVCQFFKIILDNLQMFIFRVFYLTILFKKKQVGQKYKNIYKDIYFFKIVLAFP